MLIMGGFSFPTFTITCLSHIFLPVVLKVLASVSTLPEQVRRGPLETDCAVMDELAAFFPRSRDSSTSCVCSCRRSFCIGFKI